MTLDDVKQFHAICNDIVQYQRAYPEGFHLNYAAQYANAGRSMLEQDEIDSQIDYILNNLKYVRSIWGSNTRQSLKTLQERIRG